MIARLLRLLIVLALSLPMLAWSQNGGDFSNNLQPVTKVPEGVLLVKGAWSSASDSLTPLPEGGAVTNNIFKNQYFGMTYPLPAGFTQRYEGPPPADSGRYVLAQIRPDPTFKGTTKASILITAQDMFFTPIHDPSVLRYVNDSKDYLEADYKLEQPPTQTKIAGRPFLFYAYWSPVAQLHWYVLATQIRCHEVEMVLSSRDTKLLSHFLLDMDKMTLPAEAGVTTGTGGGDAPVCISDYAIAGNMTARTEPIFSERRFNPVPVRIIIDKKGRVKHIHCLSAFPEQSKAISDALDQWRFKPYLRNGQPVDVETGVMFGRAPQWSAPSATTPVAGNGKTD